MRYPPFKLATLLLTLCFGLLLPTHNHAHFQVCDDDGQPVCDCDDSSCQSANHDHGPLHHDHHAGHHCSLCESFAYFAYVTTPPPHLTSLYLLSLSSLPRPPTPYLEDTARTHLGRDPPAFS